MTTPSPLATERSGFGRSTARFSAQMKYCRRAVSKAGNRQGDPANLPPGRLTRVLCYRLRYRKLRNEQPNSECPR